MYSSDGRFYTSFSGNLAIVRAGGRVYTAGDNTSGQLGQSVATGTQAATNLGPVIATGIGSYPGTCESFILTTSTLFLQNHEGRIFNTGLNSSGQLGRNVPTGSVSVPNIGPFEFADIKQWTATETTFHVVTNNGIYYNAGNNQYGQLGRVVASGTAEATNFGIVNGIVDVMFVATSSNTTAIFTKTGTKTAGNNQYGQLCRTGPTGSVSVTNLVDCPNLVDVAQIVMTPETTFVRKHDKSVYNCGRNTNNVLLRSAASGTTTVSNWGRVSWITSDIAEAAVNTMQPYPETSGAALMQTNTGAVVSMGDNSYGQLGRVTSSAVDLVPAAISTYPT